MTVLGLGADSDPSRQRSVTLLSGFLGSGKTTLLREELDRAGRAGPAVVVNDFTESSVDDVLLDRGSERPVVLSGGCACCTRREDLAAILAGLLDDEQRGRSRRRDVVIETSGLSDPGPIAFTVANDPMLKHHYRLRRVVVTVDALLGVPDTATHPVAFRQLVAADHLVITKADLVPAERLDTLIGELHETNPSAAVSVTAGGRLWRTEPAPGLAAGRSSSNAIPDPEHTAAIATVELSSDEPLDWQAFAVWLSLLLHRHGPNVLRVKGMLDVRGVGSVALHGVQHVIHPPEHLPAGVPGGSRVVLITRDIDPDLLRRSFHTFLALP